MIPFILLLATMQEPRDLFPPPKSLGPVETYGRHIQRTMRLLATSTREKPNQVKVLFYGQSITEQKWWTMVVDDLKRRFPHAELRALNRAVGGFSSQLLVKLVESDVAAFQPDLVIFHVYGSHIEYENILKYLRRHTSAEIMLQTDHVTSPEQMTESTDASKLQPKSWNPWMNYHFLPKMATTYQAELVPVRDLWKQYLVDHKLPPQSLLKDAVHLNDKGCQLMAAIVQAVLRYDPKFPPSPAEEWNVYQPITPEMWKGDVLELKWKGAHLDLYYTHAAARCKITLDGKPLHEATRWMIASRATNYPGSIWPCLMRTSFQQPRLEEDWTVTLTDVDNAYQNIRFKVHGSRTGEDGTGSTAERFVSNSRRVVIEPDDWSFQYARRVFGAKLEKGFTIRWQVRPYEHLAGLGLQFEAKEQVYQFPPMSARSYMRPVEVMPLVGGQPVNIIHTLRIELLDGDKKAIHAILSRNPPLAQTNEKQP
jgi:hypothetical protein